MRLCVCVCECVRLSVCYGHAAGEIELFVPHKYHRYNVNVNEKFARFVRSTLYGMRANTEYWISCGVLLHMWQTSNASVSMPYGSRFAKFNVCLFDIVTAKVLSLKC